MKQESIQEEIMVVGLSKRTSFQKDLYKKDLAELWQQFFAQGILEKIPHRLDDSIYAVYFDYEKEDQGEYTTIVGVAVKKIDSLPSNCVSTFIRKGVYKVFIPESSQPSDIQKTWGNIWSLSKSEFKRNFKTDFDKYSNNRVSIFVGCL
jgi:predicted transcriptional regulator YdeE